jgi:4-hydroxy-tetrahydrodipicolinate synthase
MNKIPNGLWPVMLTPFNTKGRIDLEALEGLIDFYLLNGSKGLFVNCLSSEMFHLSPDERLQLTAMTVRHVNGRVPVISTGIFGEDIEENAVFSKKLFDSGAAAVIINSNQLIPEPAEESALKARIELFMNSTGPVPLGIYECPVPYKRLLSPEILHWMAGTDRFVYFKDTSCDSAQIAAKLSAIKGSSFGLYNANIPTALQSLKDGANGLSPIGANYFPELYAFVCEHFDNPEFLEEINKVNTFLSIVDPLIHCCYPFSAKWFLQENGLNIQTNTRTDYVPFTSQDFIKFRDLFHAYQDIKKILPRQIPV